MGFVPMPEDPPLQELLLRWPRWMGADRGWRVLVGCAMLNASNRRSVDHAWQDFFRQWSTPERAAEADQFALADVLHPTGCQAQKAERITNLSRAWLLIKQAGLEVRTQDVAGLPGCGPYAIESWEMFVLGDRERRPNQIGDVVIAGWQELRQECGWTPIDEDWMVIEALRTRFGLAAMEGPK